MSDEVDKVIAEITGRGERLLDALASIHDRDSKELLEHLEAIKAQQDTTLKVMDEIMNREDKK